MFIFLLIQRFSYPLLDQGGILDLFPPIRFPPDRIRESAYPHYDDPVVEQPSSQITKSWSDERKPHCSWVFLALIFKIPVGLLVKWVDVVTTWERVVVETVMRTIVDMIIEQVLGLQPKTVSGFIPSNTQGFIPSPSWLSVADATVRVLFLKT